MENQNLNILDEVNKGATMGMNAISYVSEKVTDSKLIEKTGGIIQRNEWSSNNTK